jgi:hypothetical protein
MPGGFRRGWRAAKDATAICKNAKPHVANMGAAKSPNCSIRNTEFERGAQVPCDAAVLSNGRAA